MEAFTSQLARAVDGDPTAIHRARVASRRLREAISGAGLRAEDKLLRGELRSVGKALGTVRELDVTLHVLRERHGNTANSSIAINVLSRQVAHARANARKRLARTLTAGKIERLARKLSDAATALDAREGAGGRKFSMTWRWVADTRLARRAGALSEAIESAGTVYSTTTLHRVRIATKKFRYALELASETRPIPHATQHLATLKTLQGLLGDLQDLSVLLSWAYQLQGSAILDLATLRALSAFSRALENDCRYLHARFMRHRNQLLALTGRMDAESSMHQERVAS